MTKYNYIIGSGWWCPNHSTEDTRSLLFGSDKIREKDFHNLWFKSIKTNCSPQKIIIVDSASPIKPDFDKDEIEFITLTHNAGHSTNHTGKFCGWTRSVALGLQYAITSGSDYFVYVEQDVLLNGKDIIEYCIENMTTPYMFGNGQGTPQILQQSFFIIEKSGMIRFLTRLLSIPYKDGCLSPEDKFHIAASKSHLALVTQVIKSKPPARKNKRVRHRIHRRLIKSFTNYDFLPLGYGRTRPINFSDKYYYFQHGTTEEIDQHSENN